MQADGGIGHSKYKRFTDGQHFGQRKHRHGRSGRKSRCLWLSQNDAVENEVSAEASGPEADTGDAEAETQIRRRRRSLKIGAPATSSWENVSEMLAGSWGI